MGVKSGEEGGRKSSSQPRAARASRMPAAADGRSDDPARPPAPAAGSAPAPPRGTSGRSPSPSPPRSARARAGRRGSMPPPTGCSSRGCAAPIRSPVGGGAPSQRAVSRRYACRFRRQRRTTGGRAGQPPRAKRCVPPRRARSLPATFFLRPAQAVQGPPHRCLAHLLPVVLGPPGAVLQYRGHPAPLPAARRIASCSPRIARGRPGIGLRARARLTLLHDGALHRGHRHPTAASGCSQGLTVRHRSHQAFFQVGRIGTHAPLPSTFHACLCFRKVL